MSEAQQAGRLRLGDVARRSGLSSVARRVHASEALPAPVRWTLCAAVMRSWLRILARELREPLGPDARRVVAELTAETLRRRYDALRSKHPQLPAADDEPRAVAWLMAGLYQLPLQPKCGWLFDGLGGPPRGREWLRTASSMRHFDAEACWNEMTVHLGELLIVVTERLPAHVPGARQITSRMCFAIGQWYARRVRALLALPDDTPVANAIEVLRGSEYLFRVNPQHTTGADEATRVGFIDGNACPWFVRPGWNGGHCGIFGQFQAGVCSEFGLRYRLLETIPKHGGDHCRVELSPIPLRRSANGAPLGNAPTRANARRYSG